MATIIDPSNRCCHSAPVEQVGSDNASSVLKNGRETTTDRSAPFFQKKRLKAMMLNGGLIAGCSIGITVISVGSAALWAIDGLATINRPEFLSRVPLTIALIVGAASGVGIIFLMVKALFAMSDDFDFRDYR